MGKTTKKQWEHLRNLDKMVSKAGRGTNREKYLLAEIKRLRDKMGLSRWPASLPDGDVGPDEHLPDGLPANTDLFGDL
jgi:hypothetical protein